MTVWLDTLQRNLCDDKSFQIPVRTGDIYFADSVFALRLVVHWDRSKFDLDNLVGISENTIVRSRPSTIVQASKHPTEGILYIEVADTSFNLIAGQNKPLLFLLGTITDPDTIDGLNGWIQVEQLYLESSTIFNPIIYRPGFVHVVQDTSAAFTGRLKVEGAMFDTLRADTIELSVSNVAKRKVSRIAFTLKAAPGYYSFVDTIQWPGLLAGLVAWSEKEVVITPDSLTASFAVAGELALQGALLRIILRRETDSAFDQPVAITRFEINPGSCLGRLTTEDARITATAIPGDVPTSVENRTTTDERVAVIPQVSNGAVIVQSEHIDIQEIRLFDALGRNVPLPGIIRRGGGSVMIRLPDGITNGLYFLELRGRHELVYKQIRLIQ